MSTRIESDRYVERAFTRLVEASPKRAVTEQPGLPELDNHIGMRHASALYTTMYAASRALVLAAVGDGAAARLVESVTTHPSLPVGPVTSVAEPAGGDWDGLAGELAHGRPVELRTAVTSTNADGRTVSTLAATWRAERAAATERR